MAFNNVPANGWPQLKDLEKLDAIASQIENIPTFTSNDRAFLEDLPAYPDTDGTKMLTATTSEGNTSLSYEDIPEELPADPQSDGTRVLTATTSSGSTVKSWEEMHGMPDYSTTEQKTGQKWIDGKDIYFRTFTGLTITTSGNWQDTGINSSGMDTILGGLAIDDYKQSIVCSFGFGTDPTVILRAYMSTNVIKTITLYYTKATT